MSLQFYNTLTGRKEAFKPIHEGKISIYVCGITAYADCHVGHARSAIVFDVITRYFKYRGYDVFYVKNFTDVDDKIIAKAQSEGCTIYEISEKYIGRHNSDMDALGVERPSVAPRATEHIDGMINLIGMLLDKQMAYEMDGDVYYEVERFQGYGKLSGRSLEDMVAGARVNINEKKKNPLDFALWKAAKENEPQWESPWGKGRPGWHLECSVMSQHYLGDTFDIHGGGEDLIFPHHENELAQSEGVTGKPLTNYWIHHGFVRINSEKMSKSLGNIFTISDILKKYHAEVVRLFILQSHYKSPLDFSIEALNESRLGLNRLYSTLKAIQNIVGHGQISVGNILHLSSGEQDVMDRMTALPEKFKDAMDDDFATPKAIGLLFDAVRHLNGYLGEKAFSVTPEATFVLDTARENILKVGHVFALLLEDPEDYFGKDRDREAQRRGLDTEEINRLIAERWSARQAKDWGKADNIRRILLDRKVILKDTPSGTTWEVE
jgi:cysteinyl-tRNA synthetase